MARLIFCGCQGKPYWSTADIPELARKPTDVNTLYLWILFRNILYNIYPKYENIYAKSYRSDAGYITILFLALLSVSQELPLI